jgi:hypothetical protein
VAIGFVVPAPEPGTAVLACWGRRAVGNDTSQGATARRREQVAIGGANQRSKSFRYLRGVFPTRFWKNWMKYPVEPKPTISATLATG